MEERGSKRWLEERKLRPDEFERLWTLVNDEPELELLGWWIYGQPDPDVLFGAVRTRRGSVGKTIDRLYEPGLHLRLECFPLGIPIPDEILIRFQHGPQF